MFSHRREASIYPQIKNILIYCMGIGRDLHLLQKKPILMLMQEESETSLSNI